MSDVSRSQAEDRARESRGFNLVRALRDPRVRAFGKAAEYGGKVAAVATVAVSAVVYLFQTPERREQGYRDAWQVINASYLHSGSGGRVAALETLAKGRQDLSGVNVRFAALDHLRLAPGTDLADANFQDTTIDDAVFDSTTIPDADFKDSDIYNSSFRKASALKANFSAHGWPPSHTLIHVDFTDADLRAANFDGVRFYDVKFSAACLLYADFRRASFIPSETSRYYNDFGSAVIAHADFRSTGPVSKSLAASLASSFGYASAAMDTDLRRAVLAAAAARRRQGRPTYPIAYGNSLDCSGR